MKIPAIRAQIGIWVYYISALTFKQVAEHVKKIDDELHKSELLKEMLQRTISENYKDIANYIISQEERFFNSLVLAVYDGEPKWHEVRLEYEDGTEFYDLGLLELTGKEKIFPVDGQHRVEGIKKVVSGNHNFDNEKIPVILIGHKNDEEGMKKARRMFSTLNRYAKPVSLRDIIALDEDDAIAIACRDLIDNNYFFRNKRILDSKNKAISEKNKEFTTIITFYECNRELLKMYIQNKHIKDSENRKKTGINKYIEYIKKRPSEKEIDEFIQICNNYWNSMSEEFCELKIYKTQEKPDSSEYRNKGGGSLLFRPTSLLAFIRASIIIKEAWDCEFKTVFTALNKMDLKLNSAMWRNILWNPVKNTMITTNKKTVELLIIYFVDKQLMKQKDINRLIVDLQGLFQMDKDSIIEYLEDFQMKGV